MAGFLGEYSCKVDPKGRLKMPTAMKKQLQPDNNGRFVLNRGMEKCLVLYPFHEWEKVSAKVNKLNKFEKKKRAFMRYFYRGATEVTLDGTDRLLLPKHLLGYADLKSDVLMTAQNSVIEIWNPELYEALMAMDSDTFADLAEDVMGDMDDNDPTT